MDTEILLVDDDPKVLEILGVSLGRRGFNVHTATTGGEALERVSAQPPALVILDLGLPDMTGMDVLTKLRDDGAPAVPVLFLSAEANVEARVNALDGGADDFLVKPVSIRELHAKINGALRRASQSRVLGTRTAALEAAIERGREYAARTAREFKKHLLSMRTLLTMSHDLNRTLQSGDLVKAATLTLVGELRVSSAAIFGVERENAARLSLLGVRGFSRQRFEGLSIDRASTFVTMFDEDQKPRKISRNPDPRWVRSLPDLRLAVFEYAVPIAIKDEIKGIIFAGPKLSGDEYNEYDLDIMTFIANSVGIGMENARLLSELQVTYIQTLRSLVSIVEAKDPYTKGHTERVAAYAMALANRLEMEDEDLRRILFASLLHDIGKMGVLDSIINKPGPLTDEEWVLMKAHPAVGASIVEKMQFLTGTVEIVRHHHESWNGRGYPDGLAGEDIPLGARIVTVADSFDAMTTDRPYRKALSAEEAIHRLEEGAGVQFDPRLVRVFVEYMRKKGLDLTTTPPLTNGAVRV
jgi:putative nucleotidyltransferase with HDIG domain